MSILDDIRADVLEAFGDDPDSAFRPAILSKQATRQSAFGPAVAAGPIIEEPCRAFVSRYSRRTRSALDIPDTDVKILMLQRNDLGTFLTVEAGDVITTTEGLAGAWRVVTIDQDPTGATWTLQGHPVGAD